MLAHWDGLRGFKKADQLIMICDQDSCLQADFTHTHTHTHVRMYVRTCARSWKGLFTMNTSRKV
jgi:hypothetical protein